MGWKGVIMKLKLMYSKADQLSASNGSRFLLQDWILHQVFYALNWCDPKEDNYWYAIITSLENDLKHIDSVNKTRQINSALQSKL